MTFGLLNVDVIVS